MTLFTYHCEVWRIFDKPLLVVVTCCILGLTKGKVICIGNCMDESAIWEKIARQLKNCTRRSRVLFELLCHPTVV